MASSQRAGGSVIEKLAAYFSGDTVEETDAETYPQPESLTVRNVNGPVSITGTERDDVEVRYTKRGPSQSAVDRVSVEASIDETDGLRIAVDDPDSGRTAVAFEIAVPRGLALGTVRTSNGTIDVRGTGGDAALETKNGRLAVADHDGYVDLRTKNGAIDATDVTGIDRAAATNGTVSVAVSSIRTDAEISTTAGELDVRVGRIDADVVLETTVGSIDAPLVGAESTAIGHTVVEAPIGDGGATLRLATSVGSIRLRSMESAG